MNERQKNIAERRAQMPKIHRANYDKAMGGKSMKAAIKAFCLECVGWEKEEVRLCTGLACPLWPYRPYRLGLKEAVSVEPCSKQAPQRLSFAAESTKSG